MNIIITEKSDKFNNKFKDSAESVSEISDNTDFSEYNIDNSVTEAAVAVKNKKKSENFKKDMRVIKRAVRSSKNEIVKKDTVISSESADTCLKNLRE
ncbi:hypothetical protein GX51_07537 [Blastomyces parvus]|uniref:Uncharacterized protein n=1 Tax=Blastomyces parvus TaxID=2060905 RepID=A0A2B7WKC4_9EURO|nr:hypothetical protein GX51_07537 [Blastomyces parvus]